MLSHEFKLIFFHVPRTGGTSVDVLFSGAHQGHRTANSYCSLVGDDTWQHYFKFSTVRNPWEQLVSWYFYHQKTDLYKPQNILGFRAWVRNGMPHHWENWFEKTDPFCQKTFISVDGEVAADQVLRFESLVSDFAKLCRRLNLASLELPRINETIRGRELEYYDEITVDIVRDRCGEDIEFFGYEFDGKTMNVSAPCRALRGRD